MSILVHNKTFAGIYEHVETVTQSLTEFVNVKTLYETAESGLATGYYLVTGRITYWDGVKFDPYLLPVDRGDLPSVSDTILGITARLAANFAPYVVVDSAYDHLDTDTYASDMDAYDGP